MDRQVEKTNENNQKYQPKIEGINPTPFLDFGLAPKEQKGLLRVNPDSSRSERDALSMQESHNSSHALYYFSLTIQSLSLGIDKCCKSEKADRIIEHLSCLREFIPQDDNNLFEAIKLLIDELKKASLNSSVEWAKFICRNWNLILILLKRYKHDDKYFTDTSYQKMKDVATGRRYLRLWWWKPKLEKALRNIEKIVRGKK